ncbi:MAG: IclR family transcriptional regulator [Rhodocyclaceae bacterium]|nr:MAG: IclR family transcriptional regulator [Rhodocyclaceae bacterium]
MAGLAKGLAIIELFADGRESLTVADAATGTGLSRAAARRCLLTLAECGYLAFDGKFFHPLPRLLRLGFAYLNGDPLPRVAQPILESIRDRTGESISLAVLDGDDVLFIARAIATHLMVTGVAVGGRRPAHAMATGRVLLGGYSAKQLDAYFSRAHIAANTPKTIVDPTRIKAAITQSRLNGYAINDEELELGFRAIAVPVTDIQGRLVAALSVGFSSARSDNQSMIEEYLPLLKDGARTLGQVLPRDILATLL